MHQRSESIVEGKQTYNSYKSSSCNNCRSSPGGPRSPWVSWSLACRPSSVNPSWIGIPSPRNTWATWFQTYQDKEMKHDQCTSTNKLSIIEWTTLEMEDPSLVDIIDIMYPASNVFLEVSFQLHQIVQVVCNFKHVHTYLRPFRPLSTFNKLAPFKRNLHHSCCCPGFLRPSEGINFLPQGAFMCPGGIMLRGIQWWQIFSDGWMYISYLSYRLITT